MAELLQDHIPLLYTHRGRWHSLQPCLGIIPTDSGFSTHHMLALFVQLFDHFACDHDLGISRFAILTQASPRSVLVIQVLVKSLATQAWALKGLSDLS